MRAGGGGGGSWRWMGRPGEDGCWRRWQRGLVAQFASSGVAESCTRCRRVHVRGIVAREDLVGGVREASSLARLLSQVGAVVLARQRMRG